MNTNTNIFNLEDLNRVITLVVDRIIDIIKKNSYSGNYRIEHDDVKELISEEDYIYYFNIIYGELGKREEVLDIDIDKDYIFDIIIGTKYCENFEEEEED